MTNEKKTGNERENLKRVLTPYKTSDFDDSLTRILSINFTLITFIVNNGQNKLNISYKS
jgi:hypothetical protein